MQFLSTNEVNELRLRNFFENQIIDGDIRYQVKRPSGFTAHAAQNFKEQEGIILQQGDDIHGCLSLNIREAWVNDWQNIAWATDLRLSSDRKAIIFWFENFLERIKQIRIEKKIDHVFSFINKSNQIAFNTFIRPRNLRDNYPRFHLLTNFFRVSVYSKIPLPYPSLGKLRIRSLDDSNLEALAKYLEKKASKRILSTRYNVELLQFRLKNWKNFNKENFLIAYDAKGNIVGCVAPWNSSKTQQYKIIEYNDFYENMRQLNRLSTFLGFSRNMPAANELSDFYFLTHLRADNPFIFQRLLHESLEFCNKEQYVVYSSFEGDRLYKPPKDVIYTQSKFGMYLVLAPGEDLPFTHLSNEIIPDFEVAFL